MEGWRGGGKDLQVFVGSPFQPALARLHVLCQGLLLK